jgi:predicted nucleic acid-binding protein
LSANPAESQALREPLWVYLDANVLPYWILTVSHDPDNKRSRRHPGLHSDAVALINLIGQHRTMVDQITLVVSRWALTEVHGALYKDALWANGAPGKDPRRSFPPSANSLQHATQSLEVGVSQQLSAAVDLRIETPQDSVWLRAQEISEQCGIYPPDCLHLATALVVGCGLFVTQDIDFLNLIRHFKQSAIAGILADEFRGMTPPTFEAYPLSPDNRLGHPSQTALQYLQSLGY